MSYEYFYPGSPYSLEPEYGELFTGYRVKAGDLGATTSIQTANQLKEVSNLLNQGMKAVEVSTIQPEVFEMIPRQQLKEINRLSKLTGTETTLHAPIIDPSGFTQQGWNETERENTERQFENVIERAHDLNPDGNIPVTIHASGVPGAELMKDPKTGLPIQQKMIAVNQETGELSALQRDEVYYPGAEGKILQVPEEKLELRNDTQWDKGISNLNFYKKEADEMIDSGVIVLGENYQKIISGEIRPDQLNPAQQKGWNRIEKAGMMLSDISSQFISFYDQAKKYIDFDEVKDSKRKNGAIKLMEDINAGWRKEAEKGPIARLDIVNRSRMLDDSVRGLNNVKDLTHAPKIFKPVEDFVKEKASETLSNVAIHSYKKFGDKAPIISIENPPYGTAMATGSDLKNLVEETREKFQIKLMKEGASSSQAKKAAEKLIGVTWDTSHISMMRKSGFGKGQLVEEAKTIAPYVKHVHMNDNLGHTHTDLPPGMGDTPMKGVMEELEKAGFKGKKIFEGGNFFQHFQTSPHPYVLEAMGSPLYGMVAQPYWNQMSATYGNYFGLPSAYMPEQHFSLYGGGFSTLPTELGGQMPGKQSRMTGTPTA